MMTAITHFKKARAFYNLIGMAEAAKRVEGKIDGVTAQMQSNDERISPAAACSLYENNLKRNGMDSEDTIRAGILYSRGLRGDSHCIEAERLVTKLSAVSRRVLGPDHKTTIKANEVLKESKNVMFMFCPVPNYSRLCDTKMMEKSASSKAPSQISLCSTGIQPMRRCIILQTVK